MSKHSSLIGGSTCGRLLQCPGSWAATMALPPSADVSSEYALEGSFAHAVMDRLMRNRQIGVPEQAKPEYWLGSKFIDRDLTQDHIDTLIQPALQGLAELEAAYGGGFDVLGVETRVEFPGVPSAFGTTDLILGNDTHVLHVDYKFGQGVGVQAIYTDEEGERLNPQLCFYLAASMNSCKRFYKGKRKLVIAIVQPRSDTPLTHTIVTKRDIQWFIEDVKAAVVAALGRDPPLHRSAECRWCPAKISCPKWTGPLLQLADLKLIPRTEMVTKGPSPYGTYLAKAKALVDILAVYKKEVDEQLHAFLEDGGEVPGWKLKAKVKMRQWVDEEIVSKELERLGFDWDEVWDTRLATFAKVEAAAKRRGVKIPDHLRVAPPTNETTVTTSDDPAPAIDRATAIEQFRASIPLLKGTSNA